MSTKSSPILSTSPRSLPPAVVMEKLRQPNRRCMSMSRRPQSDFKAATSSLPLKSDMDDLLDFAVISTRKRCFSESQPSSTASTPQKSTASPTLNASIARSREQLGHLCSELHSVQEDLSPLVVSIRRQLSLSVNSGSSSPEQESVDEEQQQLLLKLCRCALQDLSVADVAKMHFCSILDELESVSNFEEQRMLSRAGYLRRESEHRFERMSESAIRKIRKQDTQDSRIVAKNEALEEMASDLSSCSIGDD